MFPFHICFTHYYHRSLAIAAADDLLARGNRLFPTEAIDSCYKSITFIELIMHVLCRPG